MVALNRHILPAVHKQILEKYSQQFGYPYPFRPCTMLDA